MSHTLTDGPAPSGAVRIWHGHWPLTATVVALAIAALVVAPIISLVRIAAIGDADIWPHLASYVIPTAVVQTALLLAGVAIVAAVAGAGTAWLVTAFDFPGRNTLLWLLPLPLAIPTYIAAYVYVDLLEVSGPIQSALRAIFGWRAPGDYYFPSIRSLGGAVFVIGFVLYPYVFLAARAMLQAQGAVYADAARMLGARPFTLARQIALPMARPALAVGIALVLLETLNDIGASEYLGVQTLTISVFTTWLNRGSLPGAAQIALVMLLVVVGLIWLERYGRRRQRYTALHDARIASRIVLRGRAGRLAAFACLVPVALGFIIPAGYLTREVVVRGLLFGFDRSLIGHTLHTVGYAALATGAVLVLALAATLPQRLYRNAIARGCTNLASLGYAIPGTVLALGLLSPIIATDELLNWIAEKSTGNNVGLVLMGSGAALVIAYAVRFLAISLGFMQAGLTRISGDLDDAARLLGARPLALIRDIHLPLLRPALWGAVLLVFVDCLKELPATLLLRPLNVETLSTYIYQFATRGNFEEGALAALLIVMVGILPVIRITRHADIAAAGYAQLPAREEA